MLKFKDKLVMKKKEEIVEIAGIYPAAQGGFAIPASGETVYVVKIDGSNCYLPESVVSMLFDLYIEKEPEIVKPIPETIADEILSNPKKKRVKKTTVA